MNNDQSLRLYVLPTSYSKLYLFLDFQANLGFY